MVYQHPLAYLLGLEGRALLQVWGSGVDEGFVRDRLAEVRRLVDDPTLVDHPGVHVRVDATAEAYRDWAPSYDDPGNELLTLDLPFVEDVLTGLAPGRALDVGCGTGRIAARLAAYGHAVLGVDGSADMVAQARLRHPDLRVEVAPMTALPATEGSVDVLTTSLALTHVADLGEVLAEFARVVRAGGSVVITDVHPDLVLLGSAVTRRDEHGQPIMAATHRHSVGDVLTAALAAGFTVRRFEELPRGTAAPAGVDDPAPAPAETDELGDWLTWPWSLLDRVPEATRVAWRIPALTAWHLERHPPTG